eukprot:4199348-Amphidinium_carterae.1
MVDGIHGQSAKTVGLCMLAFFTDQRQLLSSRRATLPCSREEQQAKVRRLIISQVLRNASEVMSQPTLLLTNSSTSDENEELSAARSGLFAALCRVRVCVMEGA